MTVSVADLRDAMEAYETTADQQHLGTIFNLLQQLGADPGRLTKVEARHIARLVARLMAQLAVAASMAPPTAATGRHDRHGGCGCKCCCCCCGCGKGHGHGHRHEGHNPLPMPGFSPAPVILAAGAPAIPMTPPPISLPDIHRILRQLGLDAATIRLILQNLGLALGAGLTVGAAALQAVAAAAVAATPYILGLLLLAAMWMLFFYALSMAAPLAPTIGDMLRLEEFIEEQIGTFEGLEIASLLLAHPGLAECINDCWERLKRAIGEILGAAEKSVRDGDTEDLDHLIAKLIDEAILAFSDCLEECGIPASDLIDMIPPLKQRIERNIPPYFGGFLLLGPLIPLGWLKKFRNAFREAAENGTLRVDVHRKGGFGFTEYPDDRETNADITDEDQNERPVLVPTDELDENGNEREVIVLDVDQVLDLGEFHGEHLKMRKEGLQQLIDDLLRTIASLDAQIVRGTDDGATAAERDAADRARVARDEAVRELRKLKSALRNALIECRSRAIRRGDEAAAQAFTDRILQIEIYNP